MFLKDLFKLMISLLLRILLHHQLVLHVHQINWRNMLLNGMTIVHRLLCKHVLIIVLIVEVCSVVLLAQTNH